MDLSKDVAEKSVISQKNQCFKPDTFISKCPLFYYIYLVNISTQLYSMEATRVGIL